MEADSDQGEGYTPYQEPAAAEASPKASDIAGLLASVACFAFRMEEVLRTGLAVVIVVPALPVLAEAVAVAAELVEPPG